MKYTSPNSRYSVVALQTGSERIPKIWCPITQLPEFLKSVFFDFIDTQCVAFLVDPSIRNKCDRDAYKPNPDKHQFNTICEGQFREGSLGDMNEAYVRVQIEACPGFCKCLMR